MRCPAANEQQPLRTMSSRGPVWDSRPGRGLSVGQPSGRDIFRTVATAPCRLRLTVAKRSPASKPEAMSAGSSGVGHVLSSDGHFGHPGLRSLRVRCALPSLASLAFTARSRTRATPSPPLPPGARGGRSPRRVPCPRRTSKNIRQLETTIPQRATNTVARRCDRRPAGRPSCRGHGCPCNAQARGHGCPCHLKASR